MKTCITCAHFKQLRPGSKFGDCTRWRWTDPVSGEEVIPMIGANVERSSSIHVKACNTPDPCGPAGKHWVEAPPPPPPAPVAPRGWRRILCLG